MRNLSLPLTKIITSISILLAVFIFVSSAWFNLKILSVDAPLELRENAMITTTDLLLAGGNPYALKNMPAYVNSHGILYNLVVYPFAKIFGSTFLIHRGISAFFIIAACLLFFFFLLSSQVPISFSTIAASLLYAQLVTGGYDTTARADSLGFFLFLSSIVIAVRFKFRTSPLIFSLILTMLSFLAKQYFAITIIYLSVYLFLFESKKKGIIYILSAIGGFILLFLIISRLYETYFLNTTYLLHVQAIRNMAHLYNQIYLFFKWNFGFIIILLFSGFTVLKPKFAIKFNFHNWSKPLIQTSNQVDVSVVALVTSTAAIVLLLGQSIGQFMTYFYHLLTPFILIISLKYLERRRNSFILLIGSLLIFSNLLFFILKFILTLPEIPNDRDTWQKLKTIISQHENVYNSPATAHILVRQGKIIYDNGHSEFFKLGLIDNAKWPLVSGANEYYQGYLEWIDQQISEKKFDLIIVLRYILPILPYFTYEKLSTYYKPAQIIPLRMLRQTWNDEIWIPR